MFTVRQQLPLILPERNRLLSLSERAGDGSDLLLQLESQAGFWAFEDDRLIILAQKTFTLCARAISLSLKQTA